MVASGQENPLCLIPARGGSKGIPNKNIREFDGVPLIVHTIRTALEAELGRVVVSTDDEGIADVSREYGAEVPFMRPPALASDTATSKSVALHALDTLEMSEPSAAVCLLQPTSPLRSVDDILGAAELFERHGDPVIGVTPAPRPLSWNYELDEDNVLSRPEGTGEYVTRRQDAASLVVPSGAVYFFAREHLEQEESGLISGTRGWMMPPERSVDIDDEFDWLMAQGIADGALSRIRDHLFADRDV